MRTLIRNARTFDGAEGCVPGGSTSSPTQSESKDVGIDGATIVSIEKTSPTILEKWDSVVEAGGRFLMPAFVDAHTHACWAGDRLDEWEQKLRGATYLDLLKGGGGIMSTVRAVRRATQSELEDSLEERLSWMIAEGTTTVEVKSGYGLSTIDELKMLRAIEEVRRRFAGTLVSTALLAHAIDPDQPRFVDTTIEETLPAVHKEFPHVTIDAYTEEGAWSFEQTKRLFRSAGELGHPFRCHTDQFHELGMTRWAVENGALSVDHLEATSPENLDFVGRSKSTAVMLPASGFQVDGRYGNGRRVLDAGGSLVLATNCNPGSAPTSSMPFVIALATRYLGLTVSEALNACTANAASLLGFYDRGRIQIGARADLILLRFDDPRQLAYEFGGNPVSMTFCAGRRV